MLREEDATTLRVSYQIKDRLEQCQPSDGMTFNATLRMLLNHYENGGAEGAET